MLDIILSALTPVFVTVAVQAAKFFKKNIPGAVITPILVPAFSGIYTLVTQTLLPGTPHWYFQLAYGLVGTWIFEFVKQLKSGE
jgi:hypothetical protein